MNEATDVPALATILTATLLIGGAAVTLIGSFGLLRLRELLSARPCAHAWNDARNDLHHNGVDDLFFGPWNPTCTA